MEHYTAVKENKEGTQVLKQRLGSDASKKAGLKILFKDVGIYTNTDAGLLVFEVHGKGDNLTAGMEVVGGNGGRGRTKAFLGFGRFEPCEYIVCSEKN